MRKFLHHDPDTRELRLVYTDLYNGQHERTEYRVTAGRGGEVIHRRADLDGTPVLGAAPLLYFKNYSAVVPVWTEETAVGLTTKTPCPKAANTRRKCALCAAGT